jgi:hypothetical protein
MSFSSSAVDRCRYRPGPLRNSSPSDWPQRCAGASTSSRLHHPGPGVMRTRGALSDQSITTPALGCRLPAGAHGGLAAFAVYRLLAAAIPVLSHQAKMLLTAAIFLLVGLYQLSRFKSVCLGHCRSPFDFFAHWRPGLRGAARMGVLHGGYCVGCCWALMLIFLTVGVANLAWMGIIAIAIFVEKIAPFGRRMAHITGVASLVVALAFACAGAAGGAAVPRLTRRRARRKS